MKTNSYVFTDRCLKNHKTFYLDHVFKIIFRKSGMKITKQVKF